MRWIPRCAKSPKAMGTMQPTTSQRPKRTAASGLARGLLLAVPLLCTLSACDSPNCPQSEEQLAEATSPSGRTAALTYWRDASAEGSCYGGMTLLVHTRDDSGSPRALRISYELSPTKREGAFIRWTSSTGMDVGFGDVTLWEVFVEREFFQVCEPNTPRCAIHR